MKIFYTYLWLREDGTPYYVGKGTWDRAHRKAAPRSDRVILQEWPVEAQAFEAEKFLIAYYGRQDIGTGVLRNRTAGGDGVSGYVHTLEARQNKSKAHRGLHHSLETRRAIAAGQLGNKRGPITSRKLAAKARQHGTAHMNTPEVRAKKSEFFKGRIFSADTIEKMRAAARARFAKCGPTKGMAGRKHTPATIEKMRRSHQCPK